jgi:hypothetical protein
VSVDVQIGEVCATEGGHCVWTTWKTSGRDSIDFSSFLIYYMVAYLPSFFSYLGESMIVPSKDKVEK